MNRLAVVFFLSVFSSVLFYFLNVSIFDICEKETCPFCYGNNFCNELKIHTYLDYSNGWYLLFNFISVKNVYFSKYKQQKIVIKKLAQKSRFLKLNKDILQIKGKLVNEDIIKLLGKNSNQFQVCDSETSNLLLSSLNSQNINNIWTIFKINPEPILLELFKQESKWPVPRFYGACGRCIIVENGGIPLGELESLNWYDRAYISYQLLELAEQFTFGHDLFRLYLTDISPDNIVVNMDNLKVKFVDLEHGILKKKNSVDISHHYSNHVYDEDYAFSVIEICNKDVSDHNIYSVCHLLLSRSAPYPMMKGGLLHSPSSTLNTEHLFNFIDLCVYSKEKISRFTLSVNIKDAIRTLLIDSGFKYDV